MERKYERSEDMKISGLSVRLVSVDKELDVKSVAQTLATIITKGDAEAYIREISEKSSKKDLIHE